MFINAIGHYIPSGIIPNEYFKDVNGLSDEWIYSRTGIKTRVKATEGDNTNIMAAKATKAALKSLPFQVQDVDLIVGTSYTPYDTAGTIAHYLQQQFSISNARAVYASSACSSVINGLEIVEGYFALGKSKCALLVASEHNSAYSLEEDERSGHLWGDAAAALFITKERILENDSEIIDITSKGLGNVGKGPDGVYLRPNEGGLIMPFGKDVFINACQHMIKITFEILEKNNYTVSDLQCLIPHQANIRIINKVVEELRIDKEKVVVNIDKYGNTGCVTTILGLSENIHRLKKDDLVALSVFGGGYSSGAVLIRR